MYLQENKNKKQKPVLGQCCLGFSICIQYIKSLQNVAVSMMLSFLWNLVLNNNSLLLD